MNRFLRPFEVSSRYRIAADRPAQEQPLSLAQTIALASWEQSPPAERPTKPAQPAAQRFQGWIVPKGTP